MTKKIGYTIGRFNPPHLGHVLMLDEMVNNNDFTIILIGSSNQSRTHKNPLTYTERAHLLTNLFPNTIILPLNDFYDEDLWIQEVDKKIKECELIFNTDINTDINIYTGGTGKGEDSSLRDSWSEKLGHNTVPINLTAEICEGLSATKIREHLYNNEMESIKLLIPEKVYEFLNSFIELDEFHLLKRLNN